MKKENIFNTICPFKLFNNRVTWGELIKSYIDAMLSFILFGSIYILIATTDCMGVMS